jgi:hypothetical protein
MLCVLTEKFFDSDAAVLKQTDGRRQKLRKRIARSTAVVHHLPLAS